MFVFIQLKWKMCTTGSNMWFKAVFTNAIPCAYIPTTASLIWKEINFMRFWCDSLRFCGNKSSTQLGNRTTAFRITIFFKFNYIEHRNKIIILLWDCEEENFLFSSENLFVIAWSKNYSDVFIFSNLNFWEERLEEKTFINFHRSFYPWGYSSNYIIVLCVHLGEKTIENEFNYIFLSIHAKLWNNYKIQHANMFGGHIN